MTCFLCEKKLHVQYVHHLCTVFTCNVAQESRLMVEERLLTVRGVISFTFNMPRHRCVVRVRSDIKPEVHTYSLLVSACSLVRTVLLVMY